MEQWKKTTVILVKLPRNDWHFIEHNLCGSVSSWHLLLECISKMLPYCFAYNHINYASYLTYFLGDMLQLKKSFPEIYQQVVGNFAAQLSSDKIFSRIETDKIIEMTMNKDTKIPGGTTGFLTNVGTGPRWELNASYRA